MVTEAGRLSVPAEQWYRLYFGAEVWEAKSQAEKTRWLNLAKRAPRPIDMTAPN